jgi:hypothetical protein
MDDKPISKATFFRLALAGLIFCLSYTYMVTSISRECSNTATWLIGIALLPIGFAGASLVSLAALSFIE